MNTYLFEILKELFVAWREGNRRVRIAIVIAVLLLLAGGLIVVVMGMGFALIGIGAYRAFGDPDHFKASVLSSVSGVVVSFIGGTFLVLYKSTMAQAKDYVTILERINAVGMSVHILAPLTY